MKMNDKNPEFWAAVLTGLKNAWPQILGASMAGLIAYGRLIYDGATRKINGLRASFVAPFLYASPARLMWLAFLYRYHRSSVV